MIINEQTNQTQEWQDRRPVHMSYEKIVANKETFIKYAFKTCDAFLLIFNTKKSYIDGYIDAVDPIHEELKPYLIKQLKTGRYKDYTIAERTVWNIYKCCKATRSIVLAMDYLFEYYVSSDPRDLSFYRNGKKWFDSVFDEEICWLEFSTKEDRMFLIEMGIK